MSYMKEQLTNIGGKIAEGVGEAAVKIGEQARGLCWFMFVYESEIPMEMLKEEMEE